MKNRILFSLVVTVFLGVASANAGLGDWFYGESWQFMQSVGGIDVGIPTRNPDGRVSLPVRCDVSGVTTITQKPTTVNSAFAVKIIKKKVDERNIYISVKTGLVSKNETCLCSCIDLGDIPAGDYQVFYRGSDREKHPLGSITVPSK